MEIQAPDIDAVVVTRQIERIVASRPLVNAKRSQRLLRYLVDAALANPPQVVKEYTLAIDVFDRDASYDPAVEGAVRVEAGRLRTRLRDYYSEEGKNDPLLIELPKGGYRVVLTRRGEARETAAGASESPTGVQDPSRLSFKLQLSSGTIEEDAAPTNNGGQLKPVSSVEIPRERLPSRWRGRLTWHYTLPVLLILFVLAYAGWRLTKSQPAPSGIRSVAVLPLKNLSGDPAQDYFADGTTDELITELARVPGLRVVSWNSVVQEKDTKKSLQKIATELRADLLVEGSVSRSGDTVRINAQLIDTKNDGHLWANSFEGPLSQVMTLESKAAEEIVGHARQGESGLGQSSRSNSPGQPVVAIDPAAHDAYLRGKNYFDKRQGPESVEQFQRAIDLNPTYAAAYSGLSVALQALALLGDERPDQIVPKAMAAVDKALELDPNNGDAMIARGSIETNFLWRWEAAERDLTRGIDLSPSNTYGRMMLSVYLDSVGRQEDAVKQMREAVEIDPLSFFMARHLGTTLYYARRYDEALRQLQYAREMHPASAAVVDHWITDIYEKKGMYDEAIRYDLLELQDTHKDQNLRRLLAEYRLKGWRGYWAVRLQELDGEKTTPLYNYHVGIAAIRAGRHDEALEALKRATQEHCYSVIVARVDPILDDLRGDPGFSEILAELHLPPAAKP